MQRYNKDQQVPGLSELTATLFYKNGKPRDTFAVSLDPSMGIGVQLISGKVDMVQHTDHFFQQLGDWGYLDGLSIIVSGNSNRIDYGQVHTMVASDLGNEVLNAAVSKHFAEIVPHLEIENTVICYDGHCHQNNPIISGIVINANENSILFVFNQILSTELVAEMSVKLEALKNKPTLNVQSVEIMQVLEIGTKNRP